MFREFLRGSSCVSTGRSRRELIALRLEIKSGQRRDLQFDRPRTIIPRNRFRAHASGISGVAAFVVCGIAVDNFPIISRGRDADAVIQPQHRREVADHYDEILRIARPPDERKNARRRVVRINPFEARPFEVHFEERPLRRVQAIQIDQEPLHSAVRRRTLPATSPRCPLPRIRSAPPVRCP